MIFHSLLNVTKVFAADNPIGILSPNPSIAIMLTPAINSSGQLTGIIGLLNSLLKIVFIVAGLWALINFIIAGYGFLGAGGDAKAVTKSWDRIWQSFVGLLFIVASFLLAAIVGVLLFHDATAILQPTL